MACWYRLGDHFLRRNEIDKALESYKTALELARKLYPGQPQVADALNCVGGAAYQAGLMDKSLLYLREAKEILDNHTEVGYLTLAVLNNIGTNYSGLGRFLLAFHSFKDALDRLDMTMNSIELYKTLCGGMADIVGSISQTVPFSLTKEVTIAEIYGQKFIFFIKDTYPDIVNTFYQFSLSCWKEQYKVLELLEKAREIAQRFDYESGRMVLVLLLLSMKYGELGSFNISRSCYKEAKEMAKNLPPEDDSILPGELGMIKSMKKE